MKARTARILPLLLLIAVLAPPAAPAAVEAQELETAVFNVRGLWAEPCEWYVEEFLLDDVDGLETVAADHEADTVTVVFDPAELSPEVLAAMIEDCPFLRVTDSDTHELDRDEIRGHRQCWCCSPGR